MSTFQVGDKVRKGNGKTVWTVMWVSESERSVAVTTRPEKFSANRSTAQDSSLFSLTKAKQGPSLSAVQERR